MSRKRKRVDVDSRLPLSVSSSSVPVVSTDQVSATSSHVNQTHIPPAVSLPVSTDHATSSHVNQTQIPPAVSLPVVPSTLSIAIGSPSTVPFPPGSPVPPWGAHSSPMPLQFNNNNIQARCGGTDYYSPSTSFGYRSPTWQTTSDFYLTLRSGNISVCSGCRNKFDKQAKPPMCSS